MLASMAYRRRPRSFLRRAAPVWAALLAVALTSIAALCDPTPILDTSFEGTSGPAPDGWSTWGQTAAWSWDSSVARTGSRSLSISNSRWQVGWAGPSFSADGSYDSSYPCHLVTGWVRCDLASGRSYLSISWSGAEGWICNTNSRYARASTNGNWVQLSVMALPPVGATSGQVYLRSDKNEGTVWFDDLSISVAELTVTGTKPTPESPDGPIIAPYRCLIRDHAADPLSGDARFTLAAYYTHEGNHADARTDLDSFISAFPESERIPEAKLFAAEIACDQDAADAENMLSSVVSTYPSSPEAPVALMKLGYLHIRKGRPRAEIQSDFLDVVTESPDAPCAMECLYRAARLDLRDPPDLDSALQRFQQIKENAADKGLQAEAMAQKGLTYLQRFFHTGERPQDFPDAFDTLQAVKVQFPDQVNAIGRAELRIGRYHLYNDDDPQDAKQVFESYLSAYPASAVTEFKYQLAYCSFAEELYADSASKCLAIIADPEIDPGWKAWSGFFLGHCYLKLKDYASARAAFQNVIDTYPNTDFASISQRALELIPKGSG